jgi:siderophore ferric iron reductase
MTMTANRTLHELLRFAAELVPGLNGVVREARTADETPAFEALLAHWSNACREAGPAYWSSRCWGIVLWQPVYLSVIGVHAARASLSLAHVAQPIDGGWTREVHLRNRAPAQGDEAILIGHAASEISAFCTRMREALTPVIRLNPAMMNGTLADIVLAALLAARRSRPEWTDAHVQTLGCTWLAALDIADHGGYFVFERSDGSCALALDRRTCCYHYRRRDGAMCSTCPRLAKHERIVRLNLERDAALEA